MEAYTQGEEVIACESVTDAQILHPKYVLDDYVTELRDYLNCTLNVYCDSWKKQHEILVTSKVTQTQRNAQMPSLLYNPYALES